MVNNAIKFNAYKNLFMMDLTVSVHQEPIILIQLVVIANKSIVFHVINNPAFYVTKDSF